MLRLKHIFRSLSLLTSLTAVCVASVSGQPPQARIAKFAGDRAAAISYTFDDGLRDQYTLGVPMLNEVGFKGTFFVIPGRVAKTVEEAERRKNDKRAWGTITWDELKEMADQGHEIGSHTWSHRSLPKLTPEEVDSELDQAIDEIKKHIGTPPLTLAFPFNQSSPEIKAAALKRHVATRDKQAGLGGSKTTAEWLTRWTNQQVRDGSWGIIMIHAVGQGYAAFTDPAIFRDHLHQVKAREAEIWVDTFANIARYVKVRDDASLSITERTSGHLTCTLTGTLDPALYNIPLTLVLDMPGIASAHAVRANQKLPVRVLPSSIQIDALPSTNPITITWR